MRIQLPELNAFLAVARIGSFTRAASSLNISQPALSRRIRVIEQSLGTSLFDRLPDGARLTEAGRTFFAYAERALMMLKDGEDAVQGVESGTRGQLSLAFASTFGHRGVLEAISQFRREHSGVELTLHTGLSPEVSDLVLRGKVNLGLRYWVDPDPGLQSRVIGEEIIEVVCAPEHRLAGRKVIHPADLVDETLIGYPRNRSAPDAGLGRTIRYYGLICGRFMAIHSAELQLDLIAANFGVGLLPRGAVAQSLRSGKLKSLKIPGFKNVVPIVLVRRKGAHESEAAKRMAERLTKAIARTKP